MVVKEELHALHVVLESSMCQLRNINLVGKLHLLNMLREDAQIPLIVIFSLCIELQSSELYLTRWCYCIKNLAEADPITACFNFWVVSFY